jgi:aminopeptidase N
MKRHRIPQLTLGALLLLAAGSAYAGKRVVLPDAVTPQHYRIHFTPDIEGMTFKGSAEIDVIVHRATDRIVLNAADLVIDNASLVGEPKAPRVSSDPAVETATFTFDHPLAAGKHTLKLAWHGTIYQSASGLFALDYQGPKGRVRSLFTQFENSDARRFVPCWDEPGIKATFELSVTLPAGLMPLSNMPVASTEALPGALQRVHFARSPKMSSYLLFFGTGDFERVHRTVAGVDIGIVVKRGDTANAAYALEAASELLPYFNEYFGVPYPLPKLDLIAGPGSSQFFGAMENWGAIFYFEHYLLVDPRLSTQLDRQNVYNTTAHEMAHQWFGDLVTMAWWDDLWLNEGFASWMANKATDHFHPEWKVWLQSLSAKQAVMQRDAREGTHPIITPIDDVAQASTAFDDITYTKGEAVIRALEFHVGDAAFRAGVRRYIREHQYGNTVTDDLWAAIGKESPVPITQIAHDLTRQAGVPMVNMSGSACGAAGKATATLSQTHFAIDAASTAARVWHLPVKVATLGNAPTALVISGAAPVQVEIAGCGPVILNAGQGGYLRSKYTHDALAAIAARFADLSPDDQLGILNDTVSLATAGEMPMADYLNVTKNIPATADPVVTTTLVAQLRQLDVLYRGLQGQPAFRAYARAALKPRFARVGWDVKDGESDNTGILRAALIGALGEFGDPDVVAQTRSRFQQYLAKPADFTASTRRSLLSRVAAQADRATWDKLRQMAKAASSELERRELYQLLGSAESVGLVQQALALTLTEEIPPTIRPNVIRSAAGRHPEAALDFAIAHWDKLSAMLETSSAQLFLPRLAATSANLKTVDILNAFADIHAPANARQEYVLAIARIRYAAKVRETRLPEVDRWLAANPLQLRATASMLLPSGSSTNAP